MAGKYDYIESNLLKLKQRIKSVCDGVGRDYKEIYVIAVSKTFPAELISSAVDFNQLDFGENKVQELVSKQEELSDRIIHWHLVGHLQTNKVKLVVPFVFLIHSVDSLKLAHKIQTEASKINSVVKCLIQVNTSGEEQKSGCEVQHTLKLVKEVAGFENVKIKGLMTISRMMNDEKDENERKIARENFRVLNGLFNEIKAKNIPNVDMKYLSMGMTADYDIAIEEGSNMLRIGTAIFGERN
ncbi:MAG: YggS family pyridoxal phosphate-dependent enzyme [Chlorobi bacterium]|nr:YggS family pyridoxal phosphate-dependent enzyme [Chlorobiota bacterium]MCI0716873.1 YggS family pyridoxal phosphate-dependent enzyme [Chlorobiota bacterium]